MKKSYNTHFKSPTRGQAACGLNASYVDCPLGNEKEGDRSDFL